MSTEVGAIQREKAFSLADVPAWLWLGIGVYALVLVGGRALLSDSDTYWQMAVGQWILDHHAIAARRHLFLHQGGRAVDVVVLAGAGAVCDELQSGGLGRPGGSRS